MTRRAWSIPVIAAAMLLAACSSDCPPCTPGVTFYVGELAGTLAAGSSEQVQFCVDDDCSTVTVSRDLAAGSVFVESSGVGGAGDHHITVTGPGAVQGTYDGPLQVFDQSQRDGCDICAVGAVKVAADGSIDPGTVASTTVPATPAPTTTDE